VPIHNWFVVLPRTASNAFVLFCQLSVADGSKLLGLLLLGLAGEVDVCNFEVHFRHQFNTGDLGDDGEDVGILPGIINERGRSCRYYQRQVLHGSIGDDLLCCIASQLALGQIA